MISTDAPARPVSPVADRAPAAHWPDTVAVFVGALLLFSITIRAFEAAVTDTSAQRVLLGAVPYRDFWTMYAPGSIYVMAAAYKLFGVQMMVGKVLALLTSAAGVAAFHRITLRMMPRRWAAAAAALYAVAFFNSDYHLDFGSYPPAILLVWLALTRVAADVDDPTPARLLHAGLLLGTAALFKHDVAAYACVAIAVSLLLTGRRVRDVAVVAVTVVAVMLPAVIALVLAGAADEAWIDLVRYPLGDFRVVRPESFPLLPQIWSGTLEQRGMRGVWWATLNLPSYALLAGLAGLWLMRAQLSAVQRRVAMFVIVAYPLYWSAAHVQANTHKVTIAALGVLAFLAGAPLLAQRVRALRQPWIQLTLAAWCVVLLAQDLYLEWRDQPQRVALNLPRLAGIAVPAAQAQWMTSLAAAVRDVAPPAAPLLLLGWRNDVLIHASTQLFWLSDRRILGRHHELHPGITDTEPVQRRMLQDIGAAAIMPVVVREYRFPGHVLDRWGAIYRAGGVPAGARLLDDWVAANYIAVSRFGMYEVMRPATGWRAP